jgi:hypothetical protein
MGSMITTRLDEHAQRQRRSNVRGLCIRPSRLGQDLRRCNPTSLRLLLVGADILVWSDAVVLVTPSLKLSNFHHINPGVIGAGLTF